MGFAPGKSPCLRCSHPAGTDRRAIARFSVVSEERWLQEVIRRQHECRRRGRALSTCAWHSPGEISVEQRTLLTLAINLTLYVQLHPLGTADLTQAGTTSVLFRLLISDRNLELRMLGVAWNAGRASGLDWLVAKGQILSRRTTARQKPAARQAGALHGRGD